MKFSFFFDDPFHSTKFHINRVSSAEVWWNSHVMQQPSWVSHSSKCNFLLTSQIWKTVPLYLVKAVWTQKYHWFESNDTMLGHPHLQQALCNSQPLQLGYSDGWHLCPRTQGCHSTSSSYTLWCLWKCHLNGAEIVSGIELNDVLYMETYCDYALLHGAEDFVTCYATPLEFCIREMVIMGDKVVIT